MRCGAPLVIEALSVNVGEASNGRKGVERLWLSALIDREVPAVAVVLPEGFDVKARVLREALSVLDRASFVGRDRRAPGALFEGLPQMEARRTIEPFAWVSWKQPGGQGGAFEKGARECEGSEAWPPVRMKAAVLQRIRRVDHRQRPEVVQDASDRVVSTGLGLDEQPRSPASRLIGPFEGFPLVPRSGLVALLVHAQGVPCVADHLVRPGQVIQR